MTSVSDTQAMAPAGGQRPSRRGVLCVLLLTFLLYLPSVANGFAMDDDPIANSVCNTRAGPDPMISMEFDASVWDYLGKFFVRPYWWPESHNDGLFRPISVISYGLVYQLLSKPFLAVEHEAAPQHLVNVILHTWAVYLVITLLVRLGAGGFVSLLTGLLFGVHAIHSEVVAGIIGRAEILLLCFGAQATLLINRGGWWRLLVAGGLMFMAYGSKESSFAWIPFYFCFQLAYHWMRDPTSAWYRPLLQRRSLLACLPLLLPVVPWLLLREQANAFEPPIDAVADYSSNPLPHVGDGERLLTAVKVWGYASWLCIAPFKLSCLYSPEVFRIVSSPLDAGFLASAVWLVGFGSVGLVYGRRRPLLFLAMTLFLGFSFITSNVPLPIGTIFGERLYYIPSLGICLLPGILWAWLRLRRPQSTRGLRVFLAVVALWCAGNLGVVVQRTMAWRDSGSLFTGDVLTYPMSIDLHRKCSSVYASDGPRKDFDKAIAHLVEARRIKPDYAHAYRELGKIYVRQRKWAAAIAEFERVIELGPGYGDPLGAETIAYNAIGDCKMGMSEDAAGVLTRLALIDEAIAWYARSTVAPKWGDSQGEAHNHIGMAILRKASAEPDAAAALRLRMAALRRFEQTIALGDKQQPSHARAYRLLFDSLLVERKPVVPIREILRIWPAAWEIVGRHQDHELALLMGGLAYHARLPTEYVFEPLHWVSHACPPDKRDAQFYKARLFYSDALVERGRAGEARAVLEALLLEPKFPAELKPMVQGKLRGE